MLPDVVLVVYVHIWSGKEGGLHSDTALVLSKGSVRIHSTEIGAAVDQLVLSSWKWIRPKWINY